MKNQRTGRAGRGFVAVGWELVLLGENDTPALAVASLVFDNF